MDEFAELLSYAKEIAHRTNKVMFEMIKGEERRLYEASLHLIKAGGKRLRPLATVLSGRLFGLEESIGVIAGAAVEIFHNFTLIHDDIIDRDQFRRGVPTVHVKWDEGTAILAGDLLFAKAFETLLSLTDYGINPALVNRAARELSTTAVILAEGQILDMEFEKRDAVTEEEYIKMIYKKTAALFKTCVHIGAVLAGASDEDIAKIDEFAVNIGIAFQIRDDELGIVADEKVLGKPVYSDIREGKKTILVIHALRTLSEGDRKKLLSILGNKNASKDELKHAAELIIKSGALEYSNELANKYLIKGLSALESIKEKDSEAKKLLKLLALYVTRRKY